ncbi:MAG: hypothetical protein IJB97_03165, partial [Clostridia bacterium]|nr:hypothetical protein [Clostridia bacterium]
LSKNFMEGYEAALDEHGDVGAILFVENRTWSENGTTAACSVLYGVFYENGAWGEPIVLYDPSVNGTYISSYCGWITKDGYLIWDIRLCNADGDEIEGEGFETGDGMDLLKGKIAYHYTVDYTQGAVKVSVLNTGAATVALQLKKDGAALPLYGELVNGETTVNLGSGATVDLTARLLGVVGAAELSVFVDGLPFGQISVDTSYVDLAVYAKHTVVGENNTLLVAVKNNGNTAAISPRLYVLPASFDLQSLDGGIARETLVANAICSVEGIGRAVGEKTELGAGETAYYELRLDASMLVGGVLSVYVESDNAEPNGCMENNLKPTYLTEITQTTAGAILPSLFVSTENFVVGETTDITVRIVYEKVKALRVFMDGVETGAELWVLETTEQEPNVGTLRLRATALNKLTEGAYTFTLAFGTEDGLDYEKTKLQFVLRVIERFEVVWSVNGEETKESFGKGSYPVYGGETPSLDGFVFAGGDLDGDGVADAMKALTEDVTCTAVFAKQVLKYSVVWTLANGISYFEEVEEGCVPAYFEQHFKGIKIAGWDADGDGVADELTALHSAATFTAVYQTVFGSVQIVGDPSVGSLLSLDLSGATGVSVGETAAYQWYLDGEPIFGATENAYTVQEADRGRVLSVTVSALDSLGELTNFVKVKLHNAALTYVTASDATCENAGNVAYWYCAACEGCYADENGENQLTENQIVISASGHDYLETVILPSCLLGGYTQYVCADCGAQYQDGHTAANGHTPGDWETDVAATCRAEGFQHKECTACGMILQTGKIAATGNHSTVVDAAVEATCDKLGWTEGAHCGVCGETLIARQTVEKTAHKYQDTVVPSTCVSGGYTARRCADCGVEIIVEKTNPLGHTAGA